MKQIIWNKRKSEFLYDLYVKKYKIVTILRKKKKKKYQNATADPNKYKGIGKKIGKEISVDRQKVWENIIYKWKEIKTVCYVVEEQQQYILLFSVYKDVRVLLHSQLIQHYTALLLLLLPLLLLLLMLLLQTLFSFYLSCGSVCVSVAFAYVYCCWLFLLYCICHVMEMYACSVVFAYIPTIAVKLVFFL